MRPSEPAPTTKPVGAYLLGPDGVTSLEERLQFRGCTAGKACWVIPVTHTEMQLIAQGVLAMGIAELPAMTEVALSVSREIPEPPS